MTVAELTGAFYEDEMNVRTVLLVVSLTECIAALILSRLGLPYVDLLIGAAITYLIAEITRT